MPLPLHRNAVRCDLVPFPVLPLRNETRSHAGRLSRLGRTLSNSSVIYAIELGGGHCAAGAYINGTTAQVFEQHTPQVKDHGAEALLDTVCSLVDQVAQSAPLMQAVAVSFSGFLDLRDRPGARNYGPLRDTEVMVSAPHINDIRNLPFFEWLEGAGWGVPLHIENDVNAALRSATAFSTAVSINLGTGVAAAIKRDSRIVHMPSTWSCYQIGHGFRWSLPESLTRKCLCGSIGCLEAAIGAWALTDRYGMRPQDAPAEIYEQMRNDVVEYLSLAIAELVARLSPFSG